MKLNVASIKRLLYKTPILFNTVNSNKKKGGETSMSEIAEQALTVKEAAEFLKTKPQTLDKWRITKTGPPYSRIGNGRGGIRYRLSVLVEYLKSTEGRAAA